MAADPTPLASEHLALRAHDVHQGLHDVDRNVGLVGSELETTQLVGMAAALATSVKGREVVDDAVALKTVAAEQLDIDRFAFNSIVEILEEVDFVRNVRRTGGSITSFYESVPETFERLYATLGEVWTQRAPGELEQTLIGTVQELSMGPRRVEELQIDPTGLDRVLQLGSEAEAIHIVTVHGERIAHSPFFAYEHPDSMADVLAAVDVDSVRRAFEEIRGYQGVPVATSTNAEVLDGLVAAGLVAGPALEDPRGNRQAFAIAPYGLGRPELLTIRKPILDKAMAIVTAVRMGQHFGGITSLRAPVAILRRLQDPDWEGAFHSSTRRQYGALYRLGIIRFVKNGSLYGIRLIDSADNREALQLAIELLEYGEATSTKEAGIRPQDGLAAAGTYRYPIQTVRAARRRNPLPERLIDDIFEAAMGRQLL